MQVKKNYLTYINIVAYILEFSHIINNSKQPVPQAPYILKEVRAFSRVLGTSSSLLDSTRLGPTLWLCRSFSNLRKLFPKVPSGTGNFPKASESSSRRSKPSLGFLCDPQIVIAVLYKYEALPLQNIITFTSLNYLDPRSDLRLSA